MLYMSFYHRDRLGLVGGHFQYEYKLQIMAELTATLRALKSPSLPPECGIQVFVP